MYDVIHYIYISYNISAAFRPSIVTDVSGLGLKEVGPILLALQKPLGKKNENHGGEAGEYLGKNWGILVQCSMSKIHLLLSDQVPLLGIFLVFLAVAAVLEGAAGRFLR